MPTVPFNVNCITIINIERIETMNIALWILQVLLAVAFVFAGVLKAFQRVSLLLVSITQKCSY